MRQHTIHCAHYFSPLHIFGHFCSIGHYSLTNWGLVKTKELPVQLEIDPFWGQVSNVTTIHKASQRLTKVVYEIGCPRERSNGDESSDLENVLAGSIVSLTSSALDNSDAIVHHQGY